jgi:MFS family permease
LGIAVGGVFIDRVGRRVLLAKIVSIFLILAVFLYYFGYYIPSAVVQGISLGIFVVTFGSLMGRIIKPWERAKTFAVGASLANMFLLWIQHSGYENVFLATLPLAFVFILPELRLDTAVAQSGTMNRDIVYFIFPIIVFYVLGGFMYAAMEPEFREAGINIHVLFYVLVILIAGYLYDKFGRRIVTIAGLFLLALSYVLFNRNLLLSAYLIQSSYGFLDVFSMVVWTDLSNYGSEGKHYSIGVLTIVSSIFVGYKTLIYYSLNPFDFESLALILILLASISLAVVKEPMLSEEEYVSQAMRLGGAIK